MIFAVDRAGLVGSDGETHQGCFDLTYLSMIPNMTVMAPKNKWELSDMLKFAVKYQGPIAIRYPKGEAYDGLEEFRAPIVLGRSEILFEGEKTALFPVGSMVKTGEVVYRMLKEEGEAPTLINARFVKPLDEKMLDRLAENHDLLVTNRRECEVRRLRHGCGRLYEKKTSQVRVLIFAVPDQFIEHGNPEKLKEKLVWTRIYLRKDQGGQINERTSGRPAGEAGPGSFPGEG